MNQRIRELAKSVQCERHWTEEDIEKFAELIVRECVEICRSEDWEDQQGWGKLYAHNIKKHFEVK